MGPHSVHPAALEFQRCPPSSGNAADRSRRQRGSHSIAAGLHQTGCDAAGHQLGEISVRSLSLRYGRPAPLSVASPRTWAEAVATEGPVEGLRGRVGRYRHWQQCLALLHRSHHKHLLSQELRRVCGKGATKSQDCCKGWVLGWI